METGTIRRLEELSGNAWPSLQTVLLDGWVVRFSEGYTKRSNSVSPLYEGALDARQKVDTCEEMYSDKGLDTIFKLTPASRPPELEGMLSARGYHREPEVSVQTLDIERTAAPAEGVRVLLSPEVTDDWVSAFSQMSALDDSKRRVAMRMLLNIVPRKCFASIRSATGETIACGLAVAQGRDVGLFDIVTRQGHRRLGYGRQLTLSLLRWGNAAGAVRAYLQVVADNEPAWSLYSSLGFGEAYRYWYRVKKRI